MGTSAEPRAPSPTKLERAGDIAARAASMRPADPRVRRGLQMGVGVIVVLSVGLAAIALAGDMPDVDWRFRPVALVLSFLAMALFMLCNAAIWHRILSALGAELEPRRSRVIWFASNLARYVPTSLMMPVLRVAMAEREGVPKRVCLASVVYEMSIFLTTGVVIGAYFVIDLPDLQQTPQRYLILVLPAVALVALQPRIFHTLADALLARLGREKLPLSLSGRRVLEFLGLFAGTYVIAGLSLFALIQCVYPVGREDLVAVTGAFAVGVALSIMTFVLPGGLVAREAAIAVALSPVMPVAPAVAAAVLVRIVQLAVEVLLLLVTVTQLRARNAG